MASLLHSESRRLYSWWWDSHMCPKNSKWLQDNLTDMDAKVKAMIKLIEEDADSFARRAEMYYKKRPELMKLVEEFYRAYRALAERYDHATGDLRQAQRTMAQAFPDQLPFVMGDDTPSNSEPNTPETPHPIRAFFDPENFQGFSGSNSHGTKRNGAYSEDSDGGSTRISRKGLKQLNDMFQSVERVGELSELSKENEKLRIQILHESERANKAEIELQKLKEDLAKLEFERKAILDKLSSMEKDLSHVKNESSNLEMLSDGAKAEIRALEDALEKLKAERDISLLQCQYSLEAHEEVYREYLEKIAALEEKLKLAEENLEMLTELSKKAKSEVMNMKQEISKVNEERENITFRYEHCLEIISSLENELSKSQAENVRLNSEIISGSEKLKVAEDQCFLFGKMNESLQLEAEILSKKIAAADEELSRKQSESEKLIASIEDEHCRFVKAETTLHTLQNLHSQSQEEQRALTLELRNGLQMMKDLEICKSNLEAEIEQLKYENESLNDLNTSSSVSLKNLHDELWKLKEFKEKLEAEVKSQTEHSDALQFHVKSLKEEIEGLYGRYQALMKQVESAGLDPETFGSSVKSLRDENSRLEESMMKEKAEREALLEKLHDMDELLKKNTILERSVSEVNIELLYSKDEANFLKESCRELNEEKSNIVCEKTALLSQLQIITETMQSLLGKNTSLQTSLCNVTAELEGLRAKSKGLEEFSQLLTSERSNLQAERNSLVSRLEIVEKKLDKLETRFTNLEDKYDGLEKEKQFTLSEVEKLRISLDVEKRDRASLVSSSEARLSGLEGCIQDLQVENKHRKTEFEEQLEKAVNAQVEIFILQKFIKDMEDKNCSLLAECQRHVEASKYSEKLIMELEGENMMQELESEILLDKIEMLREGLIQVLKALEIKQGNEGEPERNFVPFVLSNIRNMKKSLAESKDENQKLLIEKSILSTVLGEVHFECSDLFSKKTALEQESLILTQSLLMVDNEKNHLLEKSRQLNMEVDKREEREVALKAEIEELCEKSCEQIKLLQEELSHVLEEKQTLEDENAAILIDALAFSYQSVIMKNISVEKASKLDKLFDEMNCLREAHTSLKTEAKQLEEKLLLKQTENSKLRASMQKLEETQVDLSASNYNLSRQISKEKKLLTQKELELSDAKQKLNTVEAMKAELCINILSLEKERAEIYEDHEVQEKEIVHLRETNGSLESEVGQLHEEIEEYKIREVILTSELHERRSDAELWEAEASSFYFDFQISSVREALLENKVHELGSLCEGLEDVSQRRSVEIERMKEKVCALESEAQTLKYQLSTCLPFIASLKDHIALLEKNPVLQSKLQKESISETEETASSTSSSSLSSNAISELQKLRSRIKLIEDILVKEKETVSIRERETSHITLEAALKEIQDLRSRINTLNLNEYHHSGRESLLVISEARIGAEMKDIPLDRSSDDQMLGLWEAAEKESIHDRQSIGELHDEETDDEIVSEILNESSLNPTPESHFEKELRVDTLELSSRKGSKKSVVERLTSDAQKLLNLQISVQEIRRKIEPSKRRRKAEDNNEYDSFRGQLQAVENSVVQLMDINTELMKTLEESSMISVTESEEAEYIRQKRVLEKARKEAEKVARLELELQRIEYILMRSIDEKKSKGKTGVSRSSAAILLRNFFYSRERKSMKPKKSRFCGCMRSTDAKN